MRLPLTGLDATEAKARPQSQCQAPRCNISPSCHSPHSFLGEGGRQASSEVLLCSGGLRFGNHQDFTSCSCQSREKGFSEALPQ